MPSNSVTSPISMLIDDALSTISFKTIPLPVAPTFWQISISARSGRVLSREALGLDAKHRPSGPARSLESSGPGEKPGAVVCLIHVAKASSEEAEEFIRIVSWDAVWLGVVTMLSSIERSGRVDRGIIAQRSGGFPVSARISAFHAA